MGWLHSRPKLHDKETGAKSRIECLPDGDPTKEMPEADYFIVSCWHELGRCLSSGYGNAPLTFQEVKAYSDSVTTLDSFEITAIVEMSRAYINEQSAATNDLQRPSPHQGSGSINILRNSISEAFKAAFKRKPSK